MSHPALFAPLPPDIWWIMRTHVDKDGGNVPYEKWILWHAQFLLPSKVPS